jgi:hypothetical protein
LAYGLQGEFEFSEGTSAKWIFNVEIEELRAEINLDAEKTKTVLCVVETNIL